MSTITISFDKDLPASNGIGVVMESPITEHELAWIWDHYFSLVLNKLPADYAEDLMSETAKWAITITKNLQEQHESLQEDGLLTIGKTPAFHQITEVENEIYIETSTQTGHWPTIHSRLSNDISNEQLVHSVTALANFLLCEYKTFYRELPLHIIALKKYYTEQQPFTNEESITLAPAYAMKIAMQFHNSVKH